MNGFLLDEHIPRAYANALSARQPEINVRLIGDDNAPAKSSSDPFVLNWCDERDFILVTNNRRTMPRHLLERCAAGGSIPEILIIDLNAPISTVVDDLSLIAVAGNEEEFRDQIRYVPL